MRNYIPNISGFVDFCVHHSNGTPIYLVSGRLAPGFDLECDMRYYYNFTFPNSKREIERAIQQNIYMFDIKESNAFFYPNTNMFSGDNSEYGIRGQILCLKEKYRAS